MGDRMDFSLLNDEPVAASEGDVLGSGRAAREIAKLLHDSRTATPFTLAVDAGWGMGKSSLMRLVEAEVAQQRDVEVVWYNAWTSTGGDALEGLIKSVLMSFDRRALRRALHRLSERRTLLTAIGATLGVVLAPFGVAGLVDRFWQALSVDARSRNDMRDALRDLATEWAESAPYEPRRLLVVFIDDLDRCSEETVLAVCEAVKVYLDIPGLAFVIGCDRSALGPSGLLRDLGPTGSAFMEKIFQTSYRLPAPGGDEVQAYVRHCAERSGLRELLDDDLVKLIADRSARNPRRIKRLINGFGLECSLNPVWARFEPEAVIRTLLLQYLYGDFYRILVTGDGIHPNAAREFLEYRTARRVLGQGVRPRSEDWQTTVACVTGHGLAEPAPAPDLESWTAVLARLEEELPTAYPALARDQNFVHLVEEWLRLPQADELVQRLREGGVTPVVELRTDEGTPRGSGGVPARQRETYAGLQVLWVDDRPEGNRSLVSYLEGRGAEVLLAEDGWSAERVLRSRPVDLLLSDIARGADRDAGLTDLARWREQERFVGPAVFFAGRVTPARERQSREVGARITASGGELLQYIDEAWEEIRRSRP
ncbi:P-loop NTPase fold protein [Streptomyces poonensis]|nr:P-loop NTPase fold protein [Streptomyces poonensis]GLJ87873.1 hypothetical protein GCM10017589_04730 [Streptomyces poonensis]